MTQSNVRWNDELGWMLRCDVCVLAKDGSIWWPLTDEFWDKRHGMSRCRACWKARDREWHRQRPPEVIARHAARYRAYKAEWAARKRRQQREDEGRDKYERRKAA